MPDSDSIGDTMGQPIRPHHGRGAVMNPANRFIQISLEPDPDYDPTQDISPRTQFLEDHSTTIISSNDSPDLGFEASINPYRGCEHGCAYCYARPTHEYLGFSAGLDFETRIMVKRNAPRLLREAFAAKSWSPKVVAMSGVTDCYQPVERKLRITRGCLEVFAECRNPVAIVTKNHLIARDTDLLVELARHQAVVVVVSVTSLDTGLQHILEPRTAIPSARLAAIAHLAKAGVPVGVFAAPIIPALNDHEIPAILKAAATAGAQFASYTLVRLPHAVAPMFEQWLETHFPDRKEKVLGQIRDMRSGALNDARFGSRMRGEGLRSEQINQLFHAARRKAGIPEFEVPLRTDSFRRPTLEGQLEML